MRIKLADLRKLIREADRAWAVPNVEQSISMCGPASIKALVAYYGVKVSEKKVSRLAGATKRDGTPLPSMVDALRQLGFVTRRRTNASYEELQDALTKGPVIIDWFDVSDGHYSVVTRVTDREVTLMDPARGRKRVIPRDEFEKMWFDFETEPGAIPPHGQLQRHVFIEVTPPDRQPDEKD